MINMPKKLTEEEMEKRNESEHKKQLWKALTTYEITCSKCGYKWIPRKEEPKACPRCKSRLDWNNIEQG